MRKIPLPDEEITKQYINGDTQTTLADQYNVSPRTIQRAIRRVIGKERCSEIASRHIAECNRRRCTGVPRSEKVKEKISKAQRGKKRPDISERQRGENNHMYGRCGPLHHNYGTTHSEETRKKISEALQGRDAWNKGLTGIYSDERLHAMSERMSGLTGPDAFNWQGGKTSEVHRLRNRKTYKEWREGVFERDDYTCQLCGERGGDLQAHHVRRVSRFPEWIYNRDNGITLCEECHRDITFEHPTKLTFTPNVIDEEGGYVTMEVDLETALLFMEMFDTKTFKVTVEVDE